ncbi:RES family NAD+ phosphorylase [Photobacterium sp. 1_MG-2023]|uniref:RES family NAD+ phosphorylase n=1 Tax=Photobacterium sp. 1_MG-2023 TaxID=3062646 RepID=UPI0026E41797|nr:RES family NAD+ phosphorylase [Photobacterium sp. 1_MG-2023]MDO6705354.1 RES family NAD+ phosphorylase [Photobacterium sp. 1_MG-2023]
MQNSYPSKQFEDQSCFRLIPSKYPPINLYEDVAEPEQLEAIFAVEALTNPRLAEETGDFSRVPAEERLVGIPHCSFVMAAFTHVNLDGGRFNTADFGAYYAASDVNTALKETVYHMERILGYTREPSQDIQMRSIQAWFTADLTDLTAQTHLDSALYHPTHYGASQALAVTLKESRCDGVWYESVRHRGHHCFALYKPNLVHKVCQSAHYVYKWNGSAINTVLEMSMV